jgi:tetratricopeptide (TPR) repeat protein
MLAVLTVAAGCAELGNSQTFGRAARNAAGPYSDCYRDDFGGRRSALDSPTAPMSVDELTAVVKRCSDATKDLNRPQREVNYAHFYAAKARRLIADASAAPPSSELWRDALAGFEIVAAITPGKTTSKSPPVAIQMERTWVEAKLEASRVYSSTGRYAEAAQRASEAIAYYPSESEPYHISARYQLAQVYQSKTPPDDEQAMDALRVFNQPALDADPNADQARRQVFEIATRLGSEAANDMQSLGRAQVQFQKARDAADAANRVRPNAEQLSQAYINLGRVSMLMAGARGPSVPGGCDQRADTGRLVAAQEYFRLAGEPAEALQWAGCADMALSLLDPAVAKFRKAAEKADATSPTVAGSMQLSLARAFYRRAKTYTGAIDQATGFKEADDAFVVAARKIDRTNPDAARSLVEIGDFYIDYVRSMPIGDPRRGALIDRAVASFRSALSITPPPPVAHLRLGRIALGEPGFESRRNLDDKSVDGARFNLDRARTLANQDTEVRAVAMFLLSKLDVQRYLAMTSAQQDAVRKTLGDTAISNADRAADLGGANSSEFVSQACETRLIFRRGDDEGARFCVANELDQDNFSRGLLYQGLYNLRRAKNARTDEERDSGIEAAYVAFDKGVVRMESTGEKLRNQEVWAQLSTGRGLALGCAGFKGVGREKISALPSDLKDRATQMFVRFDLSTCRR